MLSYFSAENITSQFIVLLVSIALYFLLVQITNDPDVILGEYRGLVNTLAHISAYLVVFSSIVFSRAFTRLS